MNVNYETVKQDIIKKIENRELSPNSPIMTRKALKDKYKVAVATVDRAILDLKNEGYLYGIQGKGTFVAEKAEAYKKIGLIFCSVSHNENHLGIYYLKMYELIQKYAAGKNISTSLFMPDKNMDNKTLKTYLSGPESDIYIIFALDSIDALHFYMGLGKPFIVFAPRINVPDGIPVILEDCRQMMFEFGNYFLRKNYRRVAYIWPEQEKQIFRDRKEWLERFCLDNGIAFDSEFSCPLSGETEEINTFLKRYSSSNSRPDAMVFSRASVGIEVYSQMEKMDLKALENTGFFVISDKSSAVPGTEIFTRIEIDEELRVSKIFSACEKLLNGTTDESLNTYIEGSFVQGITG
ncbi:MAG: hypothetical protein A2017_13395 [Lentisphaerae bacterium GWF2_44_16]|nr:MAG: hypothetical protein A2017_13395 [Lentisphaerae bacterium GWF2_44_16]